MSKKIIYKIPDSIRFVQIHTNIRKGTNLANHLSTNAKVVEYAGINRSERKKFLKNLCVKLNNVKRNTMIYFNYAGTKNGVVMKFESNQKSGSVMESISTNTSIVFGIHKNYWNNLRTVIKRLNDVARGTDKRSYDNLRNEICNLVTDNMNEIITAIYRSTGKDQIEIDHLIYVKDIQPVEITPKSVGLNLGSAKSFTAVNIKNKILNYITKSNPIHTSIKKVFDQIDTNPNNVLIKLDLSYASEIKSETMEIFSAYYALKNYKKSARVQFPISQTESYDYILIDKSRVNKSDVIYVSVKNEISSANLLNNKHNKDVNDFKLRNIKTNTIKIRDIFPTENHLIQWYNQYNPKEKEKHENVEKILKPAVTMGKYGSYPILATRNLFGNNATYNTKFVTYLKQISNIDDTNIINTISEIIIKCINRFSYNNSIKMITIGKNDDFINFMQTVFRKDSGETYFTYTDTKRREKDLIIFETSYIRYICENIIEKASQKDKLANFIDVFIDYMDKSNYSLDKKPVFCIAKAKVMRQVINTNVHNELYIYFRYYNYKTMNQRNLGHRAKWISLRSKLTKNERVKESLGLDPKILDDVIDTYIKTSPSPDQVTIKSLFHIFK